MMAFAVSRTTDRIPAFLEKTHLEQNEPRRNLCRTCKSHGSKGAVRSKSARLPNASHPCSSKTAKPSGKTSTYHSPMSLPRTMPRVESLSWTRSAHPKRREPYQTKKGGLVLLPNPSDPL